MMCFFSHSTKQFSDSSWVSYTSAQLGHRLPGINVIARPTSEGLSPTACPLLHSSGASAIWVVICASDGLA